MGLKEKRALKEFQDEQFEALKGNICEAAKFDVDVEVDWDSIALDGMSHMYSESWPKVYFEPTVTALKSITADEMGLEALKGNLSKIIIKNSGSNASARRWAEFKGGVVTLDHKPFTNVDGSEYTERTQHLQKVLEDNL